MAYSSLFDGILFIEGQSPYTQDRGLVEYKGKFYNQQFKDLDNVKQQLAQKAKGVGANAIINFKYGQKNTSFLRAALLALDDNVKWYGYGQAVVLSDEQYNEIVEKISRR